MCLVLGWGRKMFLAKTPRPRRGINARDATVAKGRKHRIRKRGRVLCWLISVGGLAEAGHDSPPGIATPANKGAG